MLYKCKVYPSRDITGILPNMERITTVRELNLSKKDIIRCMSFGNVYLIVNENEILLTNVSDIDSIALKENYVHIPHKEPVECEPISIKNKKELPVENSSTVEKSPEIPEEISTVEEVTKEELATEEPSEVTPVTNQNTNANRSYNNSNKKNYKKK